MRAFGECVLSSVDLWGDSRSWQSVTAVVSFSFDPVMEAGLRWHLWLLGGVWSVIGG